MSIYGHGDGLCWPSLFSFQNEKEKKQALKHIDEQRNDYSREWLAQCLLGFSGDDLAELRVDDPCVQSACERAALKFMLFDTDLAKDLLGEEEFTRACEIFTRKQFNSKLLQRLLCAFVNLLCLNLHADRLNNLFTIPIIDEYRKAREEKIDRAFGPLKTVIEKVASGVKSGCYDEAEHSVGFSAPLNDSLNQFLVDHFNYDFNAANEFRANNEMSTLFDRGGQVEINRILQTALVNNAAFWKEHEYFSVVNFINGIAEQNDRRHAEKVLNFIIEKLQKSDNGGIVFGHGFPLWALSSEDIVRRLEEQAIRFSFKRLEQYCDVSPAKSVPLCYPMSRADQAMLRVGQKVWERFIGEFNYPNDSEKVNGYLKEEVDRFASGVTQEFNDVAVILDVAPFRFSADNEDRRICKAYHPDCFSSENIWNRVYLKAYAVTKLTDDEQTQFTYLQRIFIDLIKMIEKKTGVCTAHQLDTATRTEHYERLKAILSANGVKVNDAHKTDYVVSLLDRDTALMEESELFPVLEQTGDAIYGLAVAEMLFYNPETERMAKVFEQFTRAEAQVAIAKRLGLHRLFLHIGLPAKYMEFNTLEYDFSDFAVWNEEKLQELNREKYLADSLEMIIGSVYRDAGLYQAINFTKKLLRDTFPKRFGDEIRPTDESRRDRGIERDYWERILPSPCSVMSDEQSMLWNALNKALLVISLGTDDKSKRNFITQSFGNTAAYGEEHNYGVSWAFYDYLKDGLPFVLEKYGDTIRAYYQKNKRN